jgi:adenine-specific DNA-methyltransferase
MRPFDVAQGMPLRLGSCQRRALFDAQDDIDRRREQLIAEIEGKLQQRVSQKPLFSIRWSLA